MVRMTRYHKKLQTTSWSKIIQWSIKTGDQSKEVVENYSDGTNQCKILFQLDVTVLISCVGVRFCWLMGFSDALVCRLFKELRPSLTPESLSYILYFNKIWYVVKFWSNQGTFVHFVVNSKFGGSCCKKKTHKILIV